MQHRLAVYIFENGSHHVGVNLTFGGGKVAPTAQYDDKTIPLGVYDFSNRGAVAATNESIHNRESAWARYYAMHETRPGDNVFAGAGSFLQVNQVGAMSFDWSSSQCMSDCLDYQGVSYAWVGLGLSVPGMSIPKFGRAAAVSSAMGGSPWTTPLSLAQHYFPVLAPGARQVGRTLNPVSKFTSIYFASYIGSSYAICAIDCLDE